MDAFFKLIAAGPLFFVSAWLLMLFAGIVTLAPAIGAVGRAPGKSKRNG